MAPKTTASKQAAPAPPQKERKDRAAPPAAKELEVAFPGPSSAARDPADDQRVFAAMRFSTPRVLGGVADAAAADAACVARAYVMPGRSPLRLRIAGCQVVKVTESRKNCCTLYLRPVGEASKKPKHQTLTRFLMGLDARVLEVAKANVDAWFQHSMNADLIEEYYRGNTSTLLDHGVVARVVVDGRLPQEVLSHGKVLDLRVQLVGVQFRRQYFTCIWKLTSADVLPPRSAHVMPFLIGSDDEDTCSDFGDDDVDGELEEESGPTPDEYLEMRAGLRERLHALQREYARTLGALESLAQRLDSSAHMDFATLTQVSDSLDALLSPPSADS
jgi:hypothetical protein